MPEHEIERDGVALNVSDDGEGTPVVLLHGLTASRRYVVMGSKALERSEHRVVAYDARGHGRSSPAAEPDAYGYDALAADLQAVLDGLGIERAVLAGASMGAHTVVRFALASPERVAALCLITPAFVPGRDPDLAHWDALADGLREGGIDGFVAAYPLEHMPEAWRKTVEQVVRQRLAQHRDLGAVADALRAVPRSSPFSATDDLGAIRVPTTVVASRDEADPGHPLAVGEAWARTIPGAELRVEDEGKSPLAWQGGQLSRVISDVAARATG
ncbi:MAG: alpha/beta hydrolase [Solirubrobacteraceae bacterium]|nr:alpha/beta hydrolase [Solirubrobacteraceae bacterium]